MHAPLHIHDISDTRNTNSGSRSTETQNLIETKMIGNLRQTTKVRRASQLFLS